MNIVLLSGSNVGTKTSTGMHDVLRVVETRHPDAQTTLLDLADYKLAFSDGRPYFDYDGDTKYVTETLMAADAIIIGTTVFQASIQATLKNVFELLLHEVFRDNVICMVVKAGTA